MQSFLALTLFLLTGQVAGDTRYDGYQPGASADPNQGADSSEYFSPVTPPDQPERTSSPPPTGERETAEGAAGQAAGQQPAERQPAASQPIKPSALLQALLQAPESGRLAGELVALRDAVSNARTREEQTEVISAYWDLSAAVADYYLSAREATELQALQSSVAQPGMAWEEARRALTARIQLAQRTAELAQYRLHKLMKNPAVQGLPLPIDKPHTGAYETRYQENFAGRESNLAKELHELVPTIYRTLQLQAAQVAADEKWLEAVSRQRSPQSAGMFLLKAHELACLRRREFIHTVNEYNTQIARYTKLASPSPVGTERLVVMLIENPAPSTLIQEDSEVRTTSGEEPADSGSSSTRQDPPRTLREEDRETRRVTPGTPNGERSILVKPI